MGFWDVLRNLFSANKEVTEKEIDRSIKPAAQGEYKEETFSVVGVKYYMDGVNRLGSENPNWRKHVKTLAENGLCGKRIFRYNYTSKPVKLVFEPNNPHDRNAIMVQIAGQKVGYISRDDNRHVGQILKKHDVKFVSGFISGGPYKIVSENGSTEKMEKLITIKVKIGYR